MGRIPLNPPPSREQNFPIFPDQVRAIWAEFPRRHLGQICIGGFFFTNLAQIPPGIVTSLAHPPRACLKFGSATTP